MRAYYEALTVRDSSLSACTQAVVAAEVGHLELAYDYFEFLQSDRQCEPDRDRGGRVLTRAAYQRPSRFAVGLLILASSAVVAFMSYDHLQHPSLARPNTRALQLGFPVAPIGSDPFIQGGEKISFDSAPSHMGFAILAPSAQLANSSLLSDTWFAAVSNDSGGNDNQLELDYVSSGIAIDYSAAPQAAVVDPASVYAKLSASLGYPAASLQTVHGVPAFVVSAANGQNGFVDLVLNRVHIVIMGQYTGSQLIAIANSLSP